MSEKGQEQKRLILVSNDDGIFAPGIRALAEVASEFGEVAVIAPDRQQSAVGHAITVSDPLRVTPFQINSKMEGQAVNGTPADCVKLAHDKLLRRKPDLVLSGINHGSNAGINIIYSGTVSAATEATILGYPAIAVSCMEFSESADLSGAQEATRKAIHYVLKNGLPAGITLNINAPGGPLKGLRWARQANSRYVEEYEGRVDPHNRPYFWITGRLEILDQGDDLDLNVLKQGYASITPIQYDLTAHAFYKKQDKDIG
ncbi:5'/3'-nucleotidase SurE [Balneolaceae bacterium ANBcel3]|nr:5'/3'-nucleotidase SurE [Balneolaceae bacterium ANBcel3]